MRSNGPLQRRCERRTSLLKGPVRSLGTTRSDLEPPTCSDLEPPTRSAETGYPDVLIATRSVTMRFLWGLVGGAAPEVLRLWRLREQDWVPPARYWPISVAMVLISGAFAQAAAAETPLAAIYVGVSTPYLISWMLSRGRTQFTSAESHQSAGENGLPRVEEYRAVEVPAPPFIARLRIFMGTVLT